MLLEIPDIIFDDWLSVQTAFDRVRFNLSTDASLTHAGLILTGLTASALVAADADKALESVTIGTGLDYIRPTLSLSHLGIEALTDPDADRIFFWDDSASASKWLTVSTGLTIDGTNLKVTLSGLEDLTDPNADRILFWDDSETAYKWLACGNSVAITTTTLDTIQDIRTSASPTVVGLTLSGLTAGRVLFAGTGGVISDDSNLVWDNTNKRLGIGTSPNNAFQVSGLINFDDTNYNTLLGTNAFYNDVGEKNVGIGYEAGYYNDSSADADDGRGNVYLGYQAGKGNAAGNPGHSNVAIGSNALDAINASGFSNVAIGISSLSTNTSGYQNTAIGASSLILNTTGTYNLALGGLALYANSTGGFNVGMGAWAGYGNRTGSYNLWIGVKAGYGVYNNNNSYNTGIGPLSGYSITTGNSNVFIGYNAGYNQTDNSNRLIVDNQDRASAANETINSLLYGIFDAASANQSLRVNAYLKVKEAITGIERSTDPTKPIEGEYVIWMSNGTGYGDDGDVCIASNPNGTTKRAILFDYSAGDTW